MGPDTVFFILILLGDCQTSHLTWVMYFINSKILGAILFSNIYSALFYLISLLKFQLYMCFTFDNFHQMSGALFCLFSNILFKSFVYQFGYFLIDLYQWLLFYSYIWGFVFFFFFSLDTFLWTYVKGSRTFSFAVPISCWVNLVNISFLIMQFLISIMLWCLFRVSIFLPKQPLATLCSFVHLLH